MPIPTNLLLNARALRTRLTDAEQLLWGLLRERRFCGVKFRRQHPVGGFVLDFYCHEALLAIELDGSGHNDPAQQAYDEERSRVLQGAGIKVLRFWNHEVLNNLEAVMEQLHQELFPSPGLRPSANSKGAPSPDLRPPSPRGRGETKA